MTSNGSPLTKDSPLVAHRPARNVTAEIKAKQKKKKEAAARARRKKNKNVSVSTSS